MVEKLRGAQLRVLPYAELVIRPADVRPVTINMHMNVSDCDVSPGTADDMAEALFILRCMSQVVLAILNVRLLQERVETGIAVETVESGEEQSDPDSPSPF